MEFLFLPFTFYLSLIYFSLFTSYFFLKIDLLKFFGFQQNVNDIGENACCQEEKCYHNYCILISCG